VAVASVLLLLPLSLPGEAALWSSVMTVEGDNTRSAGYLAGGADAAGNLFAAFSFANTTVSIFASRYTPSGGWSAPTLLESDDTGDALSPQMAVDPGGNATVVWNQWNGSFFNVFAARYDIGSGWQNATMIGPGIDNDSLYPFAAADAGGNTTAVWVHNGAAVGTSIHARRWTAGLGWGGETTIFSNGTQLADLARVGADDAGDAVVALRTYAASDYHWFGLRYVPGAGWGNATEIKTPGNPTAITWGPSLAVSANGDAMFGFYKYNGTLANTWAAHFTPGGGWGDAQVIDGSAFNSWTPSIGATRSGDFLAAYSSNNGAQDRAYARWYRSGSGWAAATQVDANNATEAREPVVAVDAAGNAWVGWHTGIPPEDLNVIVYLQGTGWGTSGPLENAAGRAVSTTMAAWGPGNAVALWIQDDGVKNSVYARVYAVPPDTTPPAITLVTPASNPSATNRSAAWVNGSTEVGATFTVNGMQVMLGANGTFNVTVALYPGLNSINLTARDAAGNNGTLIVIITYNDPVPPLQAQLAAALAQIANLSALLNNTNAQLAAVQAELNATLAELVRDGVWLDSANASIANLSAQLSAALSALNQTRADLNASNAAVADLSTQLTASSADLTAALSSIAAVQANLSKDAAALNASRNASASAASEAARLRAQLNATNETLAALRADSANLSRDLNQTRADLAASRASDNASRQQANNTDRSLAGLQGQISLLTLLVLVLAAAAVGAILMGRVKGRRKGPDGPEAVEK
jgi:hypothetical protein